MVSPGSHKLDLPRPSQYTRLTTCPNPSIRLQILSLKLKPTLNSTTSTRLLPHPGRPRTPHPQAHQANLPPDPEPVSLPNPPRPLPLLGLGITVLLEGTEDLQVRARRGMDELLDREAGGDWEREGRRMSPS